MSSNRRKNRSAGALSMKPKPGGTLTTNTGCEGSFSDRRRLSIVSTPSCTLCSSELASFRKFLGSMGSPATLILHIIPSGLGGPSRNLIGFAVVDATGWLELLDFLFLPFFPFGERAGTAI